MLLSLMALYFIFHRARNSLPLTLAAADDSGRARHDRSGGANRAYFSLADLARF